MDELKGEFPYPLASTAWLADNLCAVKIVDASWRMPDNPRPARADFDERRIAGAAFFNLDEIADLSTGLPHMLPQATMFAEKIGAMGIAADDPVVVYDDQGLFSAPRAWWTFRAMGHQRVTVLDGGLRKWLAEGRPLTKAMVDPAPTTYVPGSPLVECVDAGQVLAAISVGAAKVLDARPADRFSGDAPEPRAGMRSGAMPGAISTPFGLFIGPDGTLRPDDELRARLAECGVDLNDRLITSCGSGVTAAIISLALEKLRIGDHALYDGSWADWGREAMAGRYPVVKAQ